MHVVQRGVNRARCFDGDRDRLLYLSLLEEMCRKFGCDVHAYVLMTNHVHVLATPRDAGAMSLVMKNAGQQYVQAFNRTRSRTGPLWEGRFKSSIVDSDAYLFRCQQYIELNPVRASMARSPHEYAWSSFRANAMGEASTLLAPHPLYLSLGPTPTERQYAYLSMFGILGAWDEETARIRKALGSGLPLGRPGFLSQLQERLAASTREGRSGRPRLPRRSAMR